MAAKKSKRKPPIPRKGTMLVPIFDELNEHYFGGLICGGIGWRKLSLHKEKVDLGECVFSERFIRINVILDDVEVPDYFLKYVVYHEMCHLFHPTGAEGFDFDPHNARFRSIEKRYPDFKKCVEYEGTTLYTTIIPKWRDYYNIK